MSEDLKPLVVLVGPTASGKTALSLSLARHFDGEIVSCDSVAIYREIEIGTAKPSREERATVPHHMIDVAAPDEEFTAGEYARQARQVLCEISARGKLPIVVGGTGLYLRALLEGLFPGPVRSDELRERLRVQSQKKGPGYLHRVLARMDRAAAERIHANDESKILRAIEVCLAAKSPMTEQWKQGRDPLEGYRTLKLGLNPPREQLYERINQRARAMFDRGLVEETQHLMERYGPNAVTPLRSLGYRHAGQLLAGELTREEAITAAQQGHRNYAKRQFTWFRREEGVQWLDGFGDSTDIEREAVRAVMRFTL
ncbi:MAG TPA: tRNA (adenosine(37)-N6)-dimethylallyltransferase MiaA [Terriglobales bacterium]